MIELFMSYIGVIFTITGGLVWFVVLLDATGLVDSSIKFGVMKRKKKDGQKKG